MAATQFSLLPPSYIIEKKPAGLHAVPPSFEVRNRPMGQVEHKSTLLSSI
jgi:hypothetical protein